MQPFISWNAFVAHYLSAKGRAPSSALEPIRRDAIARLKERLAADRADSPLDFTDLCGRIEDAIAPRAA